MNGKWRKWMALGAVALGGIACRERVLIIDAPPAPRRLVVNSLFHPGQQAWSIRVDLSKPVLGPIKDTARRPAVTYTIYEEGTVMASGKLPTDSSIILLPGVRPAPGKTYRIAMTAEGLSPIEAESEVPEPVSVAAHMLSTDSAKPYHWRVRWNDPPGNHYYWVGVSLRTFPSSWGGDYGDDQISFYFVRGNMPPPSRPPGSEDPFDPETPTHNWVDEMLFDDAGFDGGTAELEIVLDSSWNYVLLHAPHTIDSAFLLFRVISLSEDAYWYTQSMRAAENASGDIFSAPVQVYTNVDGGLGIWGGFLRNYGIIRYK